MKLTTTSVTIWLVLNLSFVLSVFSNEMGGINEIDSKSWQQALDDDKKLIVLFYQAENCEACAAALQSLGQVLGQPEIPTDLVIGKSFDLTLVQNLKIASFPSLIFLRENSYVIYDGAYDVESLLEWIQIANQKITKTLDDSSFEHLTQAATGATTGDWLVAFYKDSCDAILPVMESLGVRVRNKINVAKVDVTVSPLLVERFQITNCPEVIFFKQGRMYRYDFPTLEVPSLKSFVDGFYKNVKAEGVPIPKSKFDYLTEHIADQIKQQLEGENGTIILAGAAGAGVFFLLFTFLCCCRSSGGDNRRKQKKD
ncbi:unnamed protein product [Lymnaea stagnalis]|uniref:Thioredoxin domain-containing protein n=1 Tax=Lymnaea stagnalis TaxID=6523 RepID=A0AAV2I7P9_LYMST